MINEFRFLGFENTFSAYDNLKMQNEETNEKINVGAMKKRRETMPDEKRYIIYYSFETADETPEKAEENENV